ncbi:MAG TPA: pyrroline-5-carboxylate reductase [Tissierellaceae bacterium]|nr:pyrroline-5-carboxylate reductase [Tissierellaceae bacterium]
MIQNTIGFIGCGNMAQAMIKSLIESEKIPAENIRASNRRLPLKNNTIGDLNIKITRDNIEVASQSDYIILAVKPQIYEIVLDEIKDYIKKDGVLIGIGAGISSEFLKTHLNQTTKYLKAMPNTPAMVGQGVTAISPGDRFDKEELDNIIEIFSSFGRVEIVDEKLMDGVTAVSGSSPAYVFMMIEAMADAAVLEGIPRQQAYAMAAQTVMGSAKMVLDTGIHPAILKDNVCSPGGTTIEAVASLEKNGFRTAIIEAMKECANKSREMSK